VRPGGGGVGLYPGGGVCWPASLVVRGKQRATIGTCTEGKGMWDVRGGGGSVLSVGGGGG
jgi:hypothetical protein